jgi:two-component system, LytTR family, response regulator
MEQFPRFSGEHTKIRAMIIDDQPQARSFLRRYVERFFAEHIELVAEADRVDAAVEAIQRMRPELVFLDIDLTDGTGFEVLDVVEHLRPTMQIIFVTAFKEHLKLAIRYDAVDYLDKPLISKEFIQGVERAMVKIHAAQATQRVAQELEVLKAKFPAAPLEETVLTIRHVSEIQPETRLPIDNIMYCLAAGSYTEIFHRNSVTSVTASHTIGTYEQELEAHGFLRINRSVVVNPQYCRFGKEKGNRVVVTLPNGMEHYVEPLYKDRVNAYLKRVER